MTTIPTLELSDGNRIPAIGLGTYGLDDDAGAELVSGAIGAGYRLLDTALNYGNEAAVGDGMRRSGVPREELFLTTKLPGRHHGYDETLASFEESRASLGVDYVDLYLIHWPNPSVDRYVDSWRAFVELKERGLVRSIGVLNFTPAHLTRIQEETGVLPVVNQVELHPTFAQADLRAFHAEHGIVTESWSPLGTREQLMQDPNVVAAADAHGVTPTQAVLRWHIQCGALPIPRSTDPERQRQNLDVFGFELTEEEVRAIGSGPQSRLWDGDPDTHEEM
ncbi:aldo/keto reductase [Clavibacter sepedonicus]|uniref:2,5-diketo-D-gluconic acid reductase n=1 Tax=Clavibacter sepedonicus TaxID=31964 RepID=B0RGV7_CLASE|nr:MULTISPECIES: aldo/keto reductase [Clavibacter]MBD5381867.1 aldo/keto reductase [Clavibacter sp.]OQJ47021.1 2,5-diketo-D-gluconic acid reductase [Clavibacter sepedonicus]OQJ55209.1 2,5-diketo-D-gluconic acid reductase [Clavibacter sepedonicus]UUK66557.1 aldo/keto reductase [Clavibacter sepedonicus]CAQ01291.1 2,5-diketo-D-gluconic acid reductase [Clavibacter sepedonicus]